MHLIRTLPRTFVVFASLLPDNFKQRHVISRCYFHDINATGQVRNINCFPLSQNV